MHKSNFSIIILIAVAVSCTLASKKQKVMNKETEPILGTYGYDLAFIGAHDMKVVELRDEQNKAAIMISPGLQGRVLTSTLNGPEGKSFGWINYKLIESGRISEQFNLYGGEERLWLGPEGGPFSIYFEKGREQVFENWNVPPLIDTEAFEIKEQTPHQIRFEKNASLTNASGTTFWMNINRTVSLLPRDTLAGLFHAKFPSSLQIVAYQSINKITNTGENAWTKDKGLLSIWMLSMFSPSPTTTVFIPYKEKCESPIVNDDYFGKVPTDRLKTNDGTLFFKIDGKFRCKIGLPPERAKGICGSYDSEQKVITLLWCSLPDSAKSYVNSKWGKQDNPFEGDVINSYNDGPVADGTILGPFYEVETSSPAAELQPGQTLTHTQRIAHIQGDKADLEKVIKEIFNLELDTIQSIFGK